MNPVDPLRLLAQRAFEFPSEFYRARWLTAGVKDPSAVDPGTLARLPLTHREELVRDQLAHPPHGTRRFADAGHAVRAGVTGSGDDLLVLLWSAADLARERRAGVRLFARLGIQAGMRIANTLPGALAAPGSLLIGDVVEEIGALDIPLGIVENETAARQAWELIDRVQPTVLIVEPASAVRLFAAAPALARPWWQGIVWLRTDTPLFAASDPPPAAGFRGWQGTWLAVPEATSFVAYACAAGAFHVDDEVCAEVVDPNAGAPLSAGTEGPLALTPYGVDTPLLRYTTRLQARTLAGPCACGSAGPRVQVV